MILPGRHRNNLLRILRSYWPVVFAAIAAGTITWWLCPPQPRLTFQNSEGRIPLAFSPDGRILAADTPRYRHGITLWNAQTGEELERLILPDVEAENVTFSPEGELVFVDQGRIRLRTVPFGVAKETEIRNVSPNSRVEFSADGQRVVVPCGIWLQVWDWHRRELLATFTCDEFGYQSYSLASDGATLAVTNDEGIQFWDVATASKDPGSQPIGEIFLPSSRLAPNHKVLVTLEDDELNRSVSVTGTVSLWRIRGAPGEGLSALPYGEPISVAFQLFQDISPDSKMIAVTRRADYSPNSFWNRVNGFLPWLDIDPLTCETVFLDLESGERVALVPDCTVGRFSPDSRSFAGFGTDHKIHLWDIPPRKPMRIVLTVATVAGIMTWLVRRWFLRASRPLAT
jgi:WD40 repeat protein